MVAVQALAIIFGILLMLYGANSLTPAIGKASDDAATDTNAARALAAPGDRTQCPAGGGRAFAPRRSCAPPGPEDLGDHRDDAPGTLALRRGARIG